MPACFVPFACPFSRTGLRPRASHRAHFCCRSNRTARVSFVVKMLPGLTTKSEV